MHSPISPIPQPFSRRHSCCCFLHMASETGGLVTCGCRPIYPIPQHFSRRHSCCCFLHMASETGRLVTCGCRPIVGKIRASVIIIRCVSQLLESSGWPKYILTGHMHPGTEKTMELPVHYLSAPGVSSCIQHSAGIPTTRSSNRVSHNKYNSITV